MLNLCTLVTFLANVLSVSAVLPNMNFRKCRTLDNTLRITVFASVSLNECIEECLLRIQCQSMNYRRASQLCELYSNTYGGKSANNGVTQGGPCVLILREDITTPQNPRSCFCPNKEICRSENLECPASQYLGCYQDDVNRTLLDANHKHDNFMTIEMCLLQCIGYTYAAPQGVQKERKFAMIMLILNVDYLLIVFDPESLLWYVDIEC
ncbi:hypothetical protein ACF0H5_022182 [Mactra antiquata]